MKITFATGWYTLDKNSVEDIVFMSEWEDISSRQKSLVPSYVCFKTLKLLEKNKEIISKIKSFREKIGVPKQGFNELEAIRCHIFKPYPFEYENVTYAVDFTQKEKYTDILKKEYNLHPYVDHCIGDLLISNHIFNYPRELLLEKKKDKSLSITWTEKTSQNNLINFIKKNWNYIEKHNSKLRKIKPLSISDRDLLIYEMRQRDLTYIEIVEKLEQEHGYKNNDAHLNEDSVKKAYHRVKEKILTLI